jgi:quinol monooxygenase YgiN
LPAKPERRDELFAVLHDIRRASATEPGTQQWVLHTVADQPDTIALYELYDDADACAIHDGNPILGTLLPRLGDFLSGPPTILDLDVMSSREEA